MTIHRSDCSKYGYDDERGHKDADPDAACDCGAEALERAIARIDADTMIAEKVDALRARARGGEVSEFCEHLEQAYGFGDPPRDARCAICDTARLEALLVDVAQLLDGWHQDGTAWTEWDEEVRQRVSRELKLYDERDELRSAVRERIGKVQRYDLMTNYRAGSSIEEMERADEGEWVRFEAIEAALRGEGRDA